MFVKFIDTFGLFEDVKVEMVWGDITHLYLPDIHGYMKILDFLTYSVKK